VNSECRIAKFGFKKLETSLYFRVEKYFDLLNRSGVTHKCDRQRNGQTDILVENAILHYVTRPKNSDAVIETRRLLANMFQGADN